MKMKNIWSRIAAGVLGALVLASCESGASGPMKEVTMQDAGGMHISLLSKSGELTQGSNQFQMKFSEGTKAVDAGNVTVSSSMPMPGMAPMVAPIELTKGSTGEYSAQGVFGMSGSWRFDVQWDGPSGKGSTSFNASVR